MMNYTLNDFNAIADIFSKINNTSASTKKVQMLAENANNALLKSVLQYTYDNVEHNYGVTLEGVLAFSKDVSNCVLYDDMFMLLDMLTKRELTGDLAKGTCKKFLIENNNSKGYILKCILNRDAQIGMNTKSFLKVWKDFVVKTKYCRCSVLSEKTIKKIHFPCFVQLKCDGTYREARVKNGVVTFKTRSGEPYENPVMADIMRGFPDGYYMGEFTIGKADEPDEDRAKGNGLINSDNPPYDKIFFTLWDYLVENEYNNVVSHPYWKRFETLTNIINEHANLNSQINVVQNYDAENLEDALKITSTLMAHGLEGSVIKDKHMRFKDGTSQEQLKVKLKVDVDVRLIGFEKGTKGTKYENYNKVLVFETDDHQVKGRCSGLTDKEVEAVTKNPEKYLNKIFVVQFNDLVKADGHDYFALSHPRFIEFRDDKLETDTLQRIIELRDMARTLK